MPTPVHDLEAEVLGSFRTDFKCLGGKLLDIVLAEDQLSSRCRFINHCSRFGLGDGNKADCRRFPSCINCRDGYLLPDITKAYSYPHSLDISR